MKGILEVDLDKLWQIRLLPTEMVRKLVLTLEVWRLFQCAQCQSELWNTGRKQVGLSHNLKCVKESGK